MNEKSLDISIVIGKNEKFILPCIRSIFNETRIPFNIYVICNWRGQSIVENIQKEFPGTHLIVNSKPLGFAENHNSIIKKSSGKYILILNDDTVICKGAIEKLVNYMEEHSEVAVVSPKLLNPDLSLQQSTYSFPGLFTIALKFFGIRKLIPFSEFTYNLASFFYKKGSSRFWSHDKICDVDTLKGACVLIRRRAIEETGLMDEVSMAYGEETEWHYRFKKKGWKIIFYPFAEVVHYGQQTARRDVFPIEKEEIKGLLNFYRKHRNALSCFLLKAIIVLPSFFKMLFYSVSLRIKKAGGQFGIMKIVLSPDCAFAVEKTPVLTVLLLIAAISLSPRFTIGSIQNRLIQVRIEDVLLLIFGLVWVVNFFISGKERFEKPPLFFPVLAWLSIGFVTTLSNVILGNIVPIRGFFYLLKEIQYFFLYFYVFYHIKNINSAKFIAKFWLILALLNIGWVVALLTKGFVQSRWAYYGPGAIGEGAVPFTSGGFFLILFIFFFSIFLYHYSHLNISRIKKAILAAAILCLTVGIFSSGSRICILGLVLAVVLLFSFYAIKEKRLKPFIVGIAIFAVIAGMGYIVSKRVTHIMELRPEKASVTIKARIDVWRDQIELFPHKPFNILLGMGKSVLLAHEESHSQYVRNFIETGIIGSALFLFLIFTIIKKSFSEFSLGKDPFLIGLSSGLLGATIVMLFISIPTEGFVVARLNETYWSFTALTMAVYRSSIRERNL